MVPQSRTLADGRYELFEPLGSGGMATVYRGQDHRLGVARAIKVLLPIYAAKPRVRARFEAEARTMAVLDHASIVRVYDVGSNDETAWIVMEIVEGGTLLQRIGASGIELSECLRHTARVLEALTVAHNHGVVHRDIKPHNVLIDTENNARITDFGIARSAGSTEDFSTKTGTVMGTWAFMAPEQRVNAKGVDHTADIYGMGATLFAMATGQTPMDLFAADLDPEMLKNVPEALLPIIRKATLYQREKRYPDAASMLAEVRRAQDRLTHGLEPVRTPTLTVLPEDAGPPSVQTDSADSNETYVSDPSNPHLVSPALDSPETNTPLPFRPSTPPKTDPPAAPVSDPEDVSPEGLSPAQSPAGGTKRRSNKDINVILVIAILVLFSGGTILRAIKSGNIPQLAWTQPEATQPVTTPPVSAPPAVETASPEEPTLPPKTTPEAAAPTPPPDPPRPEPTPEKKPPLPTPSASPAPVETPPETTAEAPKTPDGPPSISHTPQSSARMGGFLPLQARLQNLRPIEIQSYKMTVYFRPSGTAAYQRKVLTRNRSTWTGNIRISPEMEEGIEYFLKAKSTDPTGALGTLSSQSNTSPHHVRVSSP